MWPYAPGYEGVGLTLNTTKSAEMLAQALSYGQDLPAWPVTCTTLDYSRMYQSKYVLPAPTPHLECPKLSSASPPICPPPNSIRLPVFLGPTLSVHSPCSEPFLHKIPSECSPRHQTLALNVSLVDWGDQKSTKLKAIPSTDVKQAGRHLLRHLQPGRPLRSHQAQPHLQPQCMPSLPPLDTGDPHLPGLDSGMTLGKWRREGLRGLWRKARVSRPGLVSVSPR